MSESPWEIIADCLRRGWTLHLNDRTTEITVYPLDGISKEREYREYGPPWDALRKAYQAALEENQ
jgi:hypothetical protein